MIEATTMSKIVSTISVGASVVYVILDLVLHQHELHLTSPAWPAIALMPTPAK